MSENQKIVSTNVVSHDDNHSFHQNSRDPVYGISKQRTGGLTIACVQDNPPLGDLERIFAIIREKRTLFFGKADLVMFSECFGTGYPLQDLASRPGFVAQFRRKLEDFILSIQGDGGPAILLGGIREAAIKPYNAAYLVDTDGTMQVTLKHRLPNEQVYDEKRIFAEGPMPKPLTFRGWMLGVMICEDFWHGDVTRALVDEGAEVLLVLNGSHFKVGKQEKRLKMGKENALRHRVPVIYVNQVCGQDEIVFDGASFAISQTGYILAQALAFQPVCFALRLDRGEHGIDLELADDYRFSPTPNFHAYPDRLESLYSAMVLGLRDYVTKCGFPGVLLGMSGGLDSALTAAVAVDALGADKVLLVRMPSSLTGSASMEDAMKAAQLLGAPIVDVPIAGIVDATSAVLVPILEGLGTTLSTGATTENLQARARGAMILMSLSNATGRMLVTTGNKSEMSVGYATLYGDMCGGFSVLKDVWKTSVFALAKWRNTNRPEGGLGPEGEVIPVKIIRKPPTAELAEGQSDSASLGSYYVLDPLVMHLIEGAETPERAAAHATIEARRALADLDEDEKAAAMIGTEVDTDGKVIVSTEYAHRIARMVRMAQYKRRQSPPGVVVSDRDYGLDYRFPIAGYYSL
jgi:NAD+ synthase